MAVLTRLATLGLREDGGGAALQQLGTSARDVAASVFSDGQLAARLAAPRVRQALAEIRADPDAAMRKYEGDAEVMAVLDALQRRMEATGTIDV